MSDTRVIEALRPLRVAGFRRLTVSYTLNELSWGFGTVALALLVYERTGQAMAPTGLFLATSFLPAFFAPALTARIDRQGVRRTLPALYAVEAVLFAGLALSTHHFSLAVVLVLALLDGIVAVTARALTRAAVAAALKPTGQLDAGNRLLNLCFSVAFAGGPALGGLLVAGAGIQPSVWVTSGLFAVMSLVLASSRRLPDAQPDPVTRWAERFRAGIGHVREHRTVRRVIGAHAGALTAVSVLAPIEVVYARQSIGGGQATYGLLLAAWGAGTVLSSLTLAAGRRRFAPLALIPTAAALMGFGALVMAFAPALGVAIVGCAIAGFGNGFYYVSIVQSVQDRVDDGFQARVMGLLESVTALGYGAGYLLGGVIGTILSPRPTIAIAAVGVLGAAAAITVVLRADRREEKAAPAAATAPLADVA